MIMKVEIFVLIVLTRFSEAQFLGSSLFNALSNYNDNDMCRYISCPFGQYCWNGNCISGAASLGNMRGMGGGGGGLGALTSAASLYGMGMGMGMGNRGIVGPMGYGGMISPYGMGMGGYGGQVNGLQGCSLMQQCLNGQICVNGYCSRSNVAYSGSQIMPTQQSCATGAVCPVGQYCIGGVCIANAMSTTFACHNGISCPMGMVCQLGRCLHNGLPLMGKK